MQEEIIPEANILNHAEIVLYIAICMPAVYNTLVRLNKYLNKALSEPSCLLQVFPHYGLAFILPRQLRVPEAPSYRSSLQLSSYTCLNKLYLAPTLQWTMFKGVNNLAELEKCRDKIVQAIPFLEFLPQFSSDGQFIQDTVEGLGFWFEPGVGVLGGFYNNRVLVARSLPRFLSDAIFYGLFNPKGFSRQGPYGKWFTDYWLWPQWPSNLSLLRGLCCECDRDASRMFVCGKCKLFRLCHSCCREDDAPFSSSFSEEEEVQVQATVNVYRVGENCQHWIKSDGDTWEGCFCCRCKISIPFQEGVVCKEVSCRNWLWCQTCAGGEEKALHELIPWTTACFECSNCGALVENQTDTWYECEHPDCLRGAMHAICGKCYAEPKSYSHPPEHRGSFSCSKPVEKGQKRCPSCFFRVTSKDERCPDVQCVRYEFEREAESSQEEPEDNEAVDEPVFVFDSSEEYNSSDDSSFNM